MITRPKVSSIVPSQLPEFIRDEYQTFVDFLKAYYEFLETTQKDPVTLRDIDTTLDSFITYFKSELAQNLPYSTVDQRFLLTRIKDLYLAKGSEASFRLLFRILFNKEIEIDYPSTQMLRASDGKWNQDVSVFVKVLVGHPQDIVGKLVDVVTQTKVIRVLVDRRQYVEVEVDRAIRVSDTIYELILDRRFFGTISVGDTLRYVDGNKNLVFNGVILPTTASLVVQKPGSGFKVGDLYNINNFQGYGSIMKVSAVDANGGIALGQFIKYGTGYTTDFTSSITSQKGQDTTATAGTIISRVDTAITDVTITGSISVTNGSTTVTGSGTLFTTEFAPGDYIFLPLGYFVVSSVTNNTTLVLNTAYGGATTTGLSGIVRARPGGGLNKFVNLGITETMSGFAESGTISNSDYNLATTTTLTGTLSVTSGSTTVTGSGTSFTSQVAFGDILNLSGVSSRVLSVNSNTSLTLVSNYTGSNASGLSSVSNLRPAALDGSYAGIVIREFGTSSAASIVSSTDPAIIKVSLGPLAKYPGYYVNNDGFLDDAIYIQDSRYYQAYSYVIKIDQSLNTYKTIVKNLIHPAGMAIFGEYDLRNEFTINTALESLIKILSVTVKDNAVSSDTNRFNDLYKSIIDGVLNNDLTVDNQTVYTSGDTTTNAFGKRIDGTNTNWNGTVESQSVATSGDNTVNSIVKTLNSALYNHYLNNGTTLDSDLQPATDSGTTLSTGKLLNSTTLNYDGVLDNNSSSPIENSYGYADSSTRLGISVFNITKALSDAPVTSDTDAASAADLNRTTPAFTFVKDTISESYSGTTDSGGTMLVNPYAEAGWFLNDNGPYVGTPINFTG